MKLKKVLAVSLAAAMTLSMAACGGSSSDSSAASDDATTDRKSTRLNSSHSV